MIVEIVKKGEVVFARPPSAREARSFQRVLCCSGAGLTFVVEVMNVLRTHHGHQVPRTPLRPTDDAVPLWRAETVCGHRSSAGFEKKSHMALFALPRYRWIISKKPFKK